MGPSGSAIHLADNTIRKVMNVIPAFFSKTDGPWHPRMELWDLARDRVRDQWPLVYAKG